MLTIFNRRELVLTFDMKRQTAIRDVLTQNGIDYQIKTVNRKSPSPLAAGSRARTGSFGEDMNAAYEYRIYVKKEEHEKAAMLLRNMG